MSMILVKIKVGCHLTWVLLMPLLKPEVGTREKEI